MKTKFLSLVLCATAFFTTNAMASAQQSFEYFLINDMDENLTLTIQICATAGIGEPVICRDTQKQLAPKAHLAEKEALVPGHVVRVHVVNAKTATRTASWARQQGNNFPTNPCSAIQFSTDILNFKGLMTDRVTCYKSVLSRY